MITIPTRLKELLGKEQQLDASINAVLADFSPWFYDNKLTFFPEYTDHGIEHIQNVLHSAEALISDDAWDLLTPSDAAVIILSVILHDCAMHLSVDGFLSLITGSYPKSASQYIEREISWSETWDDFIRDAVRYDGRKLRSLFGNTDPVRRPPSEKLAMTERDHLLIGEFLRKHHARLAHEIALTGVPGPQDTRLSLRLVEKDLADLAGFVARSHNMDLRKATDVLNPSIRRIHQNTHVPFVMGVLRIADFVQIQSARAPKQMMQVRNLVSPISRGEHKKHHAIKEINNVHDDPEALYVIAEPRDVRTYAALKELFVGIQTELDATWAVLGETYGRIDPLNKLGIVIRRIRSNLDDVNDFIRTAKPSFIPRPVMFHTADTEMLNLLVKPLYGDVPGAGIRELIQNAVDACRERKDYETHHATVSDQNERGANSDYDVLVTIEHLESGSGILTVEDKGIGMTLDVIENYFLCIGSSFRQSDVWKHQHTDESGHSRVLRTGRFGVGVLAAFLLGDKIEIVTRHVTSQRSDGLTFTCRIDDDVIEIRPIEAPIGTTVRIFINDAHIVKLLCEEESNFYHNGERGPSAWDWYCLEWPSVVRKIDSIHEPLSQSLLTPAVGQSMPDNWYRIKAQGFDDVMWTYARTINRDEKRYREVNLICNGIEVRGDSFHRLELDISPGSPSISLGHPTIIVSDPDGRLPLNLQRTGLATDRYPFHDELMHSVSLEYARKMIAELPRGLDLDSEALSRLLRAQRIFPSRYQREKVAPCILSTKGWLPADISLMHLVYPERLLFDAAEIDRERGAWRSKALDIHNRYYLLIDGVTSTKISRYIWLRDVLQLSGSYESTFFKNVPCVGRRILMRHDDVKTMSEPRQIPKYVWKSLEVEWQNKKWELRTFGKCPNFDGDIKRICIDLDKNDSFGFCEWYLDWDRNKSEPLTPFAEAWMDVHGKPYLSRKKRVAKK